MLKCTEPFIVYVCPLMGTEVIHFRELYEATPDDPFFASFQALVAKHWLGQAPAADEVFHGQSRSRVMRREMLLELTDEPIHRWAVGGQMRFICPLTGTEIGSIVEDGQHQYANPVYAPYDACRITYWHGPAAGRAYRSLG